MVSKKRRGDDPELGKVARAMVKASETGEVPRAHRGSAEAFQAGRRSLAYELAESGLLGSGRLGLEILYLLPDSFVIFYESLFHQALSGGGGESVMHGRSGGVEKAHGRVGMQLGSSDRGGQASGSGKKWKNTPMFVGNEVALGVKVAMDRGLEDLVRDAKRALAEERELGLDLSGDVRGGQGQGGKGGEGTTKPQGQGGVRDGKSRGATKGNARCKGAGCGRFMKAGWKFCPECGTRTG